MHDALTRAESSELLQLMRQIADDVRTLRMTAERNTGGALSRADRAALEVLLPAITDAVGDFHFTTRELVTHADTADSILLAEIARAFGPITTGTARKIGKLFNRADGFALDDLRVQRVGHVRDGTLWMIVQV